MKNKIEEKKKIGEEEIKKISLEGLKYFRETCKKHNLKYYMVSGTLLGAVRHKGYIPWDDDIDLAMPRKDYDKLIELTEEIENENWKLFSFEKEKNIYFLGQNYVIKKQQYGLRDFLQDYCMEFR